MEISTYNIGVQIKELRQYRGLTQVDLCTDICTQSLLSRIEKEEVSPSAHTLFLISLKLGVNINYFFESAYRQDYTKQFKSLIREYINKLMYQEALMLINKEKDNPLFRTPALRKYIYWNQGVCNYYLTKDTKESLDYIYKALSIKESGETIATVRDIEIMNSIANIFNDEQNLNKASYWYEKSLEYLKSSPEIKKESIYIKIVYNYALVQSKKKDYNYSIKLCDKGIEECLNNNSLYLLERLLYEKGLNSLYIGDLKGKDSMNRAMVISQIKGDSKTEEFIKRKIKKFSY